MESRFIKYNTAMRAIQLLQF